MSSMMKHSQQETYLKKYILLISVLINSTETEEGTQLYPQQIQTTNEIVEDVINFLIDTVNEGITLSNLNTVSFFNYWQVSSL